MEENAATPEQDLQTRLFMLKTQSDEFLAKFIQKVNKQPYAGDLYRNPIYLRHYAEDTTFVTKLFGIFLHEIYPEFTVDDSHSVAIAYLSSIACRTADKPGIILRGNVGSGKTALMLLWADFLKKVLAPSRYHSAAGYMLPEYRITSVTPSVLRSEFTANGYDSITEIAKSQVLIFDDIQDITINHYGTSTNVSEEIIIARYERFKLNPGMLFFGTTNLTFAKLTDAIGDRAASRLTEMTEWNKGLLSGADRRKDSNKLNVWPSFPKKNYLAI